VFPYTLLDRPGFESWGSIASDDLGFSSGGGAPLNDGEDLGHETLLFGNTR